MTSTVSPQAPVLAGLNERAMLVNLNIRGTTFRRHDGKITKEVADSHNADVELGSFNKKLIPKSVLQPITRAAAALRQEHYKRTLPWSQEGQRVLLSAGYFDYLRAMSPLEGDYQIAAQDFIRNYDWHMSNAISKAGTLIESGEYPSVEKVRRMFSVAIDILPFQTAQDFRVNLGSMETQRIQDGIQERVERSVAEAMKQPYQQIREVVRRMVDRLKAYSYKVDMGLKGRTGAFTDSITENIRELVGILPSLNLADDPQLDAMTERLRRELLQSSPQALRNSKEQRSAVLESAEEILAAVPVLESIYG